jgi:asparagine synthase (glutamine-hydrolysing)
MCGIVGYAGQEAIDPALLGTMASTLAHRGPDSSGSWISPDRTVGYGHRRLAIIDLSPGGHQPMTDNGGSVHLAFNGEIYNYRALKAELERDGIRFRSQSDTEVILEAYRRHGEAFVEKLDGQFALALYDEARGQLFLARDRAGEKPLFVWQTQNRVVFASELKALFAFPDFPRRLSLDGIEHYFAYGYVPRDLCILEGVRKLEPGHIARYTPATREWRERAYWDLPAPPTGGKRSAADYESELESLLEAAVRKQLVADVPVAVLLSGGIDSSLVTAMAVRAHPHIKTFNVSFPGHGSFDESVYARIVAKHFGTEHIEVEARQATVDLLPRLARQYDEPIADSSMIPTFMVSSMIREHATVALGGDGGDELFGGYPYYTHLQRLDRVRRAVPAPLRGLVSAFARRLPLGVRGRSYLLGLSRDARASVIDMNVYFDPPRRRTLLHLQPGDGRTPERTRIALGADATSLLGAAQRADFRGYMVDDILVKVDRASMLASLEMRAPFLDHHVIDFAFGQVPDSLKADLFERKILLRRLAARLLPKELDLKRKQGFSIPIGTWLRGEWGPYFHDVLAAADPVLFDRQEIEALFAGQGQGLNYAHRLYAIVMFELWRREYGVTL